MQDPNYRERTQFDLDWGINTEPPMARISQRKISNAAQGNGYQASWTSTVRNNFRWAVNYLGRDFERFTFIDVGSGKGKVNIIWQQELTVRNLSQRNVGIDYYEPLVTIARNNWRTVFPDRASEFYVADALQQDLRRYGDQLLLYMFNPFSGPVMLQILEKLKDWPSILIYNVPTCDQMVRACRWSVVEELRGDNENQTTTIYRNY